MRVNPPTWPLGDAKSPATIPTAAIRDALRQPGVAGFSLAQMWDVVETLPGQYDFSTADALNLLCLEAGKPFAWRLRAGRHTPYFYRGEPAWTIDGMTLPRPFTRLGAPNGAFLAGLRALYKAVAAWTEEHPTAIFHGTWYGGPSAELFAPEAVKTLEGYSDENLLNAYLANMNAGRLLPSVVPVEFPISGFAPMWLRRDIAREMAASFRPRLLQVNYLDDRRLAIFPDWPWGAVPRHGVQMVHDAPDPALALERLKVGLDPDHYDWPAVYANARKSKASYVEVYLKSFQRDDAALLLAEVAR